MNLSRQKYRTAHTDQELIENFKSSGNNSYIGELFHRYSHLMSALAFKYLKDSMAAEDAVMDVFEIMMRDLKTHEVQNFKSWVYSVTKNHCLKRKRKSGVEEKRKQFFVNSSENFVESAVDTDLIDETTAEDPADKLEDALGELKKEQRECVVLFYLEKKNYQEIADITGYELKKVKSHIQNGKRMLKSHLESNQR